MGRLYHSGSVRVGKGRSPTDARSKKMDATFKIPTSTDVQGTNGYEMSAVDVVHVGDEGGMSADSEGTIYTRFNCHSIMLR